MRIALKKGWKWLLGSILTLLGFSGCDRFGIFRCEYGQPMAHFKLIGDVKDTKGHPIKGIRVVHAPNPNDALGWENDTIYSDARGHFEIELLKHDWPDDLQNSTVTFEDVDGSENGSYKTKVLTRADLDVKQSQKGDGSWYSGAFTATANAVLEEED